MGVRRLGRAVSFRQGDKSQAQPCEVEATPCPRFNDNDASALAAVFWPAFLMAGLWVPGAVGGSIEGGNEARWEVSRRLASDREIKAQPCLEKLRPCLGPYSTMPQPQQLSSDGLF